VSEVNGESGSHEEFERLAMPLLDPLYNFARWLTQDDTEAEDLVQETFLKALKGFSSFTAGTDFRAWIFRILRNSFLTSRTALRAKLTVQLAPDEEETVVLTWETPESLALASANREFMKSALRRLPVHFREAVLLCDVEEFTYQEIADVLSIPIGTVMSRIARGRKLLREILTEERSSKRVGSQ
jgi:RNA polymerase sigma-70 factor (ECF subfamily)